MPVTPKAQPESTLGRVVVPVSGTCRMRFESEVRKIVLSFTSQATPSHVAPAGPARSSVAVPSGVAVNTLKSIE